MLEDKIRATDYEATSEAIEEQVAHESYLQWLRENDQRSKGQVRGCGQWNLLLSHPNCFVKVAEMSFGGFCVRGECWPRVM